MVFCTDVTAKVGKIKSTEAGNTVTEKIIIIF
jgi:hypothetical protein